ncbi:SdpI family protein [Williamsia sp.]|uniref:SdpI family protein n=1 Tax=Williamsia sp. TaxID=1872085 RepID=UPI0025E09B8F|nr:SdpI family protein [Williamsia sp.]
MNSVAVGISVADFVLAVAFGVTGVLGLMRRLPRNRFVGIRTPVTLRSDETFAVAHVVAGPGLVGGAVILALAGVIGIGSGGGVGLAFALVGLVAALVILGAASSFGLRAAARVPDWEESCGTGGGCGSCALQGACSTPDSATPDSATTVS